MQGEGVVLPDALQVVEGQASAMTGSMGECPAMTTPPEDQDDLATVSPTIFLQVPVGT